MRLTILFGLLLGAAFGQPAAFEAADVHPSHVSPSNFNIDMNGPIAHASRYEIRTATMLDLVSTAYGLDEDKVLGGPPWLELDRYDIIAKPPAGSTREGHKQMLQTLLAERFHLVVHNESKPLPAYILTAGKHPQLKAAGAPPDQKGCQSKPRPKNIEPGTILPGEISCHGLTMADVAEQLAMRAGGYLRQPVVDSTGLKGAYDFDLKWTGRGQLQAAGAEGISIFDAVDRQLGLKLELGKVPTPVIIVESVNEKPTDNAPDLSNLLPNSAPPTEFEVAAVKPTPADDHRTNFNLRDNGQLDIMGMNMKSILRQAFDIYSDDMIVGMPKWAEEDRFDIVAKVPRTVLDNADPKDVRVDFEAIMVMLRNLLADRFKLATHLEERTIPAYNLVAAKPKMKPADPTERIKCANGPGSDGKDPRDSNPILNRLISCQNMTMSRFADMLQSLASGYIHAPVLDATGLEGAWDFTLSFSGAGVVKNGGRDGGSPAAVGTTNAASDPNGALTLLDALPKQIGVKLELTKRSVKVLVIDHIDQKPTDN
jgi:uncharacterized protein (TIGR03435 family)